MILSCSYSWGDCVLDMSDDDGNARKKKEKGKTYSPLN
jgi:hypothetical protein